MKCNYNLLKSKTGTKETMDILCQLPYVGRVYVKKTVVQYLFVLNMKLTPTRDLHRPSNVLSRVQEITFK